MEAKCSPATSTLFSSCLMHRMLLLLLLLSMASCHKEMKSIYVGQHQVLPMRIGRPAFGPESLAFDHRGDGPYTGVSNGRVLRWRGARRGWTEFAHNYKHATVAECAAKKKLVAPESLCGRPLGLQFHRATGDLYFADAYLGLMRVGRRGGLAEAVATKDAGGAPLNFVNGVDVDQETGHVYFTDSSAAYQRSDYLMIILTGDATGRLLRPRRAACSATGCAGHTEPFADLPGYPDNVRRDDDDGYYWVALNRDKSWAAEGTTPRSVAAVRVRAEDGAATEALRGLGNATVSEVLEREGALWLGSVDTPYVSLFRISRL
ncbi:hypothetical protein QOZ80_6BG0486870 [Eleusine coracana subsp. coracana]|nr:hypothetical protein QOZ80_6BG0486870 [Eleusine coracana subsp. coracana]